MKALLIMLLVACTIGMVLGKSVAGKDFTLPSDVEHDERQKRAQPQYLVGFSLIIFKFRLFFLCYENKSFLKMNF